LVGASRIKRPDIPPSRGISVSKIAADLPFFDLFSAAPLIHARAAESFSSRGENRRPGHCPESGRAHEHLPQRFAKISAKAARMILSFEASETLGFR
jgi:hypothetical protein